KRAIRPCSGDVSLECQEACPWAFPFDRNTPPSFRRGSAPSLEFFRGRKAEARERLRDKNLPDRPSCIHPPARKPFRDAKFEPRNSYLTVSSTLPPSVLHAEPYHRAVPRTPGDGVCRPWSILCTRSGPPGLDAQTLRSFPALRRQKGISP